MLRHKVAAGFFALLVTVSSASAGVATTVDFSEGTPGFPVDGFYSAGKGVTFFGAEFANPFGVESTPGNVGIRSIDNQFRVTPDKPIVAEFDAPQQEVSIVGYGTGSNGIRLEAYDKDGGLVGFDEFFGDGFGEGNQNVLSVSGPGIRKVVFFQPGSVEERDLVIFDDLSFIAEAPEPTSLVLGCIGAVGMGLAGIRRRRQKKQPA